MRLVHKLHTAITTRAPGHRLPRWLRGDRGDNGVVPSAILLVGFAAVALTLVILALAMANDWMSQAPGPGDLP